MILPCRDLRIPKPWQAECDLDAQIHDVFEFSDVPEDKRLIDLRGVPVYVRRYVDFPDPPS